MSAARRLQVIFTIADRVGTDERQFQLKLGANHAEAALAELHIMNETVRILNAKERPAVNLAARLIRNPSTTTRTS